MNINKAKNDIVYFAENALGYELLDWQKDLLLKYQQGEMIFNFGHRYGKNLVIETIKAHEKFTS
ncbi:hypothetical protein BKM15_25855 [Pseudomonas syringae pv. syringae]|nr:hypothetical protein BKM15_25840 [Pseudomonas syringae pv. syringae]POD46270.1 hypothetical protein BKM15_25855 [Pseudomonas syringae pv. syringae]